MTSACRNCGVLLEFSHAIGRRYAVGDGSPHWCAIVELAPPIAIECCCGAHVERDRDGVKWEHGEPHVCSVRRATPIGERGNGPRPVATQEKANGAAIGSVAAALPRSSPEPLEPIYRRAEYRR